MNTLFEQIGGTYEEKVTIQLSLNGTNESVILIPLSFEASISCKMAFSQAKTLILRPEIDIGSNILLLLGDVHAAACGLQSGEFPRRPRWECYLVPFK